MSVKEQRQSGAFDSSVIQSAVVPTSSPVALSSDERKKFDEERVKLFIQLDERVNTRTYTCNKSKSHYFATKSNFSEHH